MSEKRYSTNPNFQIDPKLLEEASKSNAPPPALADAIHEAAEGPKDDTTLVPCPACRACRICHGEGMVTATAAAQYLSTGYDTIDLVTEPPDD